MTSSAVETLGFAITMKAYFRTGVPGAASLAQARRGILEAAPWLMARGGYARMSVDTVATRAGVTKPTIYLHYRGGEAELATAALAFARDRSAVEETGNTRVDLDIEIAVAMLVGAFYAGYLSGRPFPPHWAETAVDTILDGLRSR